MSHLCRPQSRDGFEVAIICALPIERNAVEALLEVDYETDGFSYGKAAGDLNTYTTGRLGNQHVVLAYMPGTGTISSTAVAANLRSSFENIKMGIVVGICGGVPKTAAGMEILLGDVIISTSVIHIDFGRLYPHKFIRKKEVEDTLGRASPEIRAFIGKMSGYLMSERLKVKTSAYSAEICSRKEFLKSAYPGPEKDHLYRADCLHKHWTQGYCPICDICNNPGDEVCEEALKASCTELGCSETQLVERGRLQKAIGMDLHETQHSTIKMQDARKVCIHFGRMACSNQVMKSAHDRDWIAAEEGVIGFEMESAGTWDYVPTVVIKSVCDYADSHKDKQWQAYAATTAAACTKAVLEAWRSVDKPVRYLVNQEHLGSNPPIYPVHWTVTRSANPIFTGRNAILNELESIVCDAVKGSSPQNQCWIVLCGMGGQGKSEICLQLVNRVRQSFWGVFWVDISTESLAESGFVDIANRLHITVQRWEDARQGLANIKEPWLLVLDNADNPDIDYLQYFPTGTSGVVILTSRNIECRQYATRKFIDLQGLPDPEACELLLRAAGMPVDGHRAFEHDVYVVARLLRSHPLALIQAGSYMSRGHCNMKEYPHVFDRQRKRLLEFRPSQARSRYGDVYATFEASAAILKSMDGENASDALEFLPVLASCSPNRLPTPLFEAAWKGAQTVSDTGEDDLTSLTPWHVAHLPAVVPVDDDISWDKFRLVEAINLLKAFSLVSTDTSEGFLSVSMHHLVHAWARDRLHTKLQHQYWVVSGCLFAISRQDSILWQNHNRQLQPHLQSLVSWRISEMFKNEPQLMICRILMNCGWLLQDMRDDAKVFELMDNLCTYLGLDQVTVDRRWLNVYNLYARTLHFNGKAKAAAPLLEQVVKIQEQMLAETHPDRLASQHTLAGAYRANGQTREAISLLEQVVKIREQILPEDHPDRLASQHALAIVYQANGQIKKGVLLLEQSVKIQKQILAEDHPSRLALQHTLAGAYRVNGQIKEAVSLLEHVVKIREQALAEDHPHRLASQHELARAYGDDGQVKEAVSLLEHVVKIREKLAEYHPDRLASRHALAVAYKANKQTKQAISLLEQVVTIKEQMLAENHPSRLASQYALALAYEANGQAKEAISLLEHIVTIRERTLAEDHPDRIASWNALAGAYKANGQVNEVTSTLEKT
ncbi:Nephrocystin-3 [Talaromyces islandicus]|uniref:Nephrocystin-3 n=1 Tax=Talaromyces islandicus TaxID=28573 RepID=A0A0U1LZE1_TALIS|nr:Nephrocystin-3 [Talaromyces islandicus]